MAKQAAVRVGLHAFCVGITPHPPMNRFSSRHTLEFLSTTDRPSSFAPARVVPQICVAAPGASNLGSPPGRKSPRLRAILIILTDYCFSCPSGVRRVTERTLQDLLIHHSLLPTTSFLSDPITDKRLQRHQLSKTVRSCMGGVEGLLEACRTGHDSLLRM